MSFKEWYKFNFEDNKLFYIGNCYVKIFRKKSFKTEDLSFKALIPIYDIVNFFGDYNIIFINYDKDNNDEYNVLCFGLYKENGT